MQTYRYNTYVSCGGLGRGIRYIEAHSSLLKPAGFQLLSSDKHIPRREGQKTLLLGRDVVKLITPGTLIEPLDNEANYLLCIATGPGSTVGLAWIDISTGEFQVRMFICNMSSAFMHAVLKA